MDIVEWEMHARARWQTRCCVLHHRFRSTRTTVPATSGICEKRSWSVVDVAFFLSSSFFVPEVHWLNRKKKAFRFDHKNTKYIDLLPHLTELSVVLDNSLSLFFLFFVNHKFSPDKCSTLFWHQSKTFTSLYHSIFGWDWKNSLAAANAAAVSLAKFLHFFLLFFHLLP